MSDAPPPGDAGEPPRNAKAEAKAAKAYAKAERPWYKKKRWILSIAGVLLVIAVAAGSSSSTEEDTTAETTSTEQAAPTPSETTETETQATEEEPEPDNTGPTDKLPITDGDWSLDTLRIKDDGLGDFGATGRVSYSGSDSDGGSNIFTVTIFKDGEEIGSLTGSAEGVAGGDTETVTFISQDKFEEGPYEFDFQNDL